MNAVSSFGYLNIKSFLCHINHIPAVINFHKELAYLFFRMHLPYKNTFVAGEHGINDFHVDLLMLFRKFFQAVLFPPDFIIV